MIGVLGQRFRERIRKPTGTPIPIFGHPLAPTHAWLLNEAGGNIAANACSPRGWGAVGGSAAFGVLGNDYYESNLDTQYVDLGDASLLLPLANCTFAIRYQKTDTTLRAGTAFGTNIGIGAESAEALLPWSDGVVYWDWGGFTGGTSRLSASGLTFGDDIWVFSSGPRGMEIWQNGVLRASQSGSATRTSTTQQLRLGPAALQPGDVARTHWFMVFDRQLSQEAALELSVTPFAGFEQRSKVFYSFAISSNDVTGTVASTAAAATSSATVLESFAATVASAASAATSASSASEAFDATAASNAAAAISAAIGTESISGSIDSIDSPATSSSTGAQTEGDDVVGVVASAAAPGISAAEGTVTIVEEPAVVGGGGGGYAVIPRLRITGEVNSVAKQATSKAIGRLLITGRVDSVAAPGTSAAASQVAIVGRVASLAAPGVSSAEGKQRFSDEQIEEQMEEQFILALLAA